MSERGGVGGGGGGGARKVPKLLSGVVPAPTLWRVFSYVFWARFLTTLLDPHKVLNLKNHFEFSFSLRHFREIPFMLSAFFSG